MANFLKLKDSNCKNCYKCIRECPVKSIRFSNEQAHIIGNECIFCGQCFVVCPQNAKEIASSVEDVKALIASGDPVIASLAPSFIANYPGVGIDSMQEALRAIGFAHAEETAIGATIVKKEYERMLREEQRDILISSCCHSVNLLIQKYFPNELKYLANCLSPMQAHSQDIKRRYPGARTVFIGPCIAKKDEADHYRGTTDAVLTFEELTHWLDEEHITLEQRMDHREQSKARFFPTTGGILKTMDCNEAGYSYLAIDGLDNCIAALKDIHAGGLSHCFIEMSACVGSCVGGPVMDKRHHLPVRDYIQVEQYAGKEQFVTKPYTAMELSKAMEPIDIRLKMPEEHQIQAQLKLMGKRKPEDELNCGSCGYNTCREKAIAVCHGKADLGMCMPFLMSKAESFSDNVIGNSSNAIIVLNESFEVQQINRAALAMMNIRLAADVLGEPVVRIMDPTDFATVKHTGVNITNKRVYLAEYKKYVYETIVYDRHYHIFICFMRDITEEENQRMKKETISKHTIEITDKVVEKQMRIVQEIASLLGETAAETKVALTKLKESIQDE